MSYLFDPDYVIAPGETLRGWMDEHGYEESCGQRVGIDTETMRGILAGEAALTSPLARKLSSLTGVGVSFWLTLEHNYRVGLAAGKTRVGTKRRRPSDPDLVSYIGPPGLVWTIVAGLAFALVGLGLIYLLT